MYSNSLRTHIVMFFAACIMLLAFNSCKPGIPRDVLSEKKMRNLLYDYHLANALAETKRDSMLFYKEAYSAAVFRKHGVTPEQFDHSMQYYSRHADRLADVYKALNERLGKVTTASNTPIAHSANGDTVQIWNYASPFYLVAGRNNHFTETFKPDTALHASDAILWRFTTDWYYKEVKRQASAFVKVTYPNDSVQVVARAIYSTGEQNMRIQLSNLEPKEIQLFIYQPNPYSDELRILSVSNMIVERIKGNRQQLQTPVGLLNRDSIEQIEREEARRSHKSD